MSTANFSDDETDIYVNAAARLKALKKKNPPKKVRERAPELQECSTVIEDKEPDLQMCVSENGNRDKTWETTDLCEWVSTDFNDRPRTRSTTRARNKAHTKTTAAKSIPKPVVINEDPVIIDLDEDCDIISVEDVKEDDNYEVNVKVLWRSQTVHRIPIMRYDSFEKVFQYFAKLENVPLEQVQIMRKETMVKHKDTPVSLNLSVIDILEGGIISAGIVSQSKTQCDQDEIQENVCNIKVQISNKKAITIPLKKDRTFDAIVSKCAEELCVQESQVKLYFDGDRITKDDTPESLDLEEEACIDLRIS